MTDLDKRCYNSHQSPWWGQQVQTPRGAQKVAPNELLRVTREKRTKPQGQPARVSPKDCAHSKNTPFHYLVFAQKCLHPILISYQKHEQICEITQGRPKLFQGSCMAQHLRTRALQLAAPVSPQFTVSTAYTGVGLQLKRYFHPKQRSPLAFLYFYLSLSHPPFPGCGA